MVSEVEAAVDPDAVLRDRDVFLGINGPLAGRGDPFTLGQSANASNTASKLTRALCRRIIFEVYTKEVWCLRGRGRNWEGEPSYKLRRCCYAVNKGFKGAEADQVPL